MTKRFQKFFDDLLSDEGWYSNHPKDRGGETVCGISRNYHSDWSGWKTIDTIKKTYKKGGYINQVIKSDPVLIKKISSFYYNNYFKNFNLHKIKPEYISEYIFNISVNIGGRTAGKILQTAINLAGQKSLTVDGAIGPRTLSALHKLIRQDNITERILKKCISGELYIYYKNIIERNPDQGIFFRGWVRTRVR